MKFKILFLSLIIATAFSNVNATTKPAVLFVKQKFDQVLREQALNAKGDITVCQTYYSQVIQDLMQKLDDDKKLCDENKTNELAQLSNNAIESRNAITGALSDVCENLQTCKDDPDNLEFFECVNNSGDPNARAIWKASKDSSEIAADIREQQHAIDFKNEQCASDADRNYIVGTTKATDDLLACYANGGLKPNTVASPVEPKV